MKLGDRELGRNAKPIIVAELSGNHNGSISRALDIIDASAQAGADAVKLQTYTADSMTLDCDGPDFVIDDPASLWHGRKLYELYQEASTPWDWHPELFHHAKKRGMVCFSTPFDESAVDYLEQFDPPAYKIASFEVTDLDLIETVARTGRPIIMSTGMATLGEIDAAVRRARAHGSGDIVLLKCTSTYPALPLNSNIETIVSMRGAFACEVGISDHTAGVGVAVAAVALGACLVEKHVTLSRSDGGVDAAFSMEPDELSLLVVEAERAWQAKGQISYGPTRAEEKSLRFRRSIYVSEDIAAGEECGRHNLRVIRPGYGLAPRHFASVIGRRARVPLKRGTALAWEMLA